MDSSEKRTAGKIALAVLIFIIVIVGIVTFTKAFVAIDTGKVGVVTNYGRVTGRELKEGVSFISPFTEDVTVYDVKTQKIEAQSAAATKDLQDVNATVVVNYVVNAGKVSEIHQSVGPTFQATVIDQQIQEAFKAVSAEYTASELITNRAQVKAGVLESLKERVEKDKRYTIQDIAITNFTFSAAFNQAIEAVQIANQNIAKAKQEYETAKIEADKIIVAANAAAEAQRVQQQTLTQEILQKQAIEKWDGKLPVYSTNGSMFFNIPTGK